MDYTIKKKDWYRLKKETIPQSVCGIVWYKGDPRIKAYILKHYDKLHYFKTGEIECDIYKEINTAVSFTALSPYSKELIYNALYDKNNRNLYNEQHQNIDPDIVYLIESVIEVKDGFLYFSDKSGNKSGIDLKECCKNYAEEFNADKGEYFDLDGVPVKDINPENSDCVGTRDICAKNPCFTLYTLPQKTRFEMIPKKKKVIAKIFKVPRNTDEFRMFHLLLQNDGWTTLDLT